MQSTVAERYRARFRQVLAYIDAHLSEELTVERLCSVATLSKYHFHRQFTALFGIGVYRYIQLTRLKRAAHQLAFRERRQIIDIALASGYEGPEAFTRAFRKSTGQSPSEFRKQPQWNSWYAAYQHLSKLRMNHMKPENQCEQVRIVHFAQTKVAVFEHRGDPKLIGNSIRQFIEWRRQNNLPPRLSETFNIAYDDPDETHADDYRMDLCAATDREIAVNPFGVVGKIIPGGKCAVLRHIGSDETLGASARYLYSEWLPQSAQEVRDFPLYFQRISFFPDVPEHEAVVDVFLPLR